MRLPVVCPLALLVLTTSASAQVSLTVVRGFSYEPSQTRILALEPSGHSVYFSRSTSSQHTVYHWTATGGLTTAAPPTGTTSSSFATGGGPLGGTLTGTIGDQAATWTPGQTPDLLPRVRPSLTFERATACSGGGDFVCGYAYQSSYYQPDGDVYGALWSVNGAFDLGTGLATGVSRDGAVVAGIYDTAIL